MKTNVLVLLLSLSLLTGCSKYVVEAPSYPANLTVKCSENLPELTGTTGKDLVTLLQDWAMDYHECKNIHNGLVDVIETRETETTYRWIWE